MLETSIRRVIEQCPPGTQFTREGLLLMLDTDEPREPTPPTVGSWRERLWDVPADTRLGVEEVAEAVGRSKSWVYRHTSEKSGLPQLPHRKLDGVLEFPAGELRTWIQRHEMA